MSETMEAVYAWLDRLGIAYRVAVHAPTADMRACAAVDRQLGALTPKNIFLTTKNRKRCCLCLMRPDARFHTSDISRQAGSSRLSFAPEEMLLERLRCRGGSASPLGLIFPEAREVELLLDSALRRVPVLAFHPCDNTQTVAMTSEAFFGAFLPSAGARVTDLALEGQADFPPPQQ